MLMHRTVAHTFSRDDIVDLPEQANLRMEPFTPLSERIALGQADLVTGLRNLKQSLPGEEFDRYIESLIALRLRDGVLWLITDREMHRSIVERNFLALIKTAFSVQKVRVISQA